MIAWCPICLQLIPEALPDTTTCGKWECRQALAPRLDSPEAAPPRATTPHTESAHPLETGTAEGANLPSPVADSDLWDALEAFADARHRISAREGTIVSKYREDALQLIAAHTRIVDLFSCRAPIAASPSRESGALLDAWGEKLLAHFTRKMPASSRDHEYLAAGYAAREERAAVDRHLSTLERDAARMREALEGITAVTQPLALLLAMGAPVPPDELLPEIQRISRTGIAALTPSGEPTTTPETSADAE
jgi:hypothetical protein